MNELCYFYNTKSELMTIMKSLADIRQTHHINFNSFLCRVVKPYLDRTQGGRRVNGFWCCVVEFLNEEECDKVFYECEPKPIRLCAGIEKRLQSRAKWNAVAELVNMDKMPRYYSEDKPSPINVEGYSKDLESACSALIKVLDEQTDPNEKVSLAYSWFLFTNMKHFNCYVRTLCDCEEEIK